MANREITAILKLESKLGSLAAFDKVRQKVAQVESRPPPSTACRR